MSAVAKRQGWEAAALASLADLVAVSTRSLSVRVESQGACAADGDRDDWYPVASGVGKARREAARPLRVCGGCPVRTACLELSLRIPAGRYGVWGGLVEGERRALALARQQQELPAVAS